MRFAPRILLTLLLTSVLGTPAALAAGGSPTATTASTTPQFTIGGQSTPQPAPGTPFGPLQSQVDTGPTTQPTVTGTKRVGDTGNGHSTLLFLSAVALIMIAAVGVFIWYEGTKKQATAAKRRRQRMRSGRPAQAAASMSAGSRQGPPPPPRKRKSAAKRKKR